jgi:hypothetical protein
MTVKELALAKGFTEAELLRFGLRNGPGAVEIPYLLADGSLHPRFRVRSAPKAGDGSKWSAGSASVVPYGLNRPVPIDKYAFIVEGESDCWALWTAGMPALGLPGASTAHCLRAEHVSPASLVYVVSEPGEAGKRFPHVVANALYDSGFPGRVFPVTLPWKDPQEGFAADRKVFKPKLREAIQAARSLPRPQAARPVGGLLSLADLYDEVEESVDYLIEGLLPAGGIMLLSARPKAGKSVLARNVAHAVATGGEVLGRRCKAGPVLWLALEERKNQVREQVAAMGVPKDAPLLFHFGQAPDDAMRWLADQARTVKPALIVVDTFLRLTRIESINDYSQVTRASEPLLALAREGGFAQIWLHHNNKSNDTTSGVSGSNALVAAVDTTLILTRGPDGMRTVFSEQRSGEDMEETVVRMDPETFRVSSAGSKQVAELRAAETEILAGLGLADEPVSRDETLAFSQRRATVKRAALRGLETAGFIQSHGDGVRGRPRTYSIKPSDTPGSRDTLSPNPVPIPIPCPAMDDLTAYAERLL